jgi:hypothetical protein
MARLFNICFIALTKGVILNVCEIPNPKIEANLGQPGKESDVHVYKIRGEV